MNYPLRIPAREGIKQAEPNGATLIYLSCRILYCVTEFFDS